MQNIWLLFYDMGYKRSQLKYCLLFFFSPFNQTAEALATKELHTVISNCPYKLIAETYDGVAALSEARRGVQARVKEKCMATQIFIHRYTHQVNLNVEKAKSQNSSIRVFFNSLLEIHAFSSRSPQRMDTLKNAVSYRIPNPSATRWNIKSRTVNVVHKTKDALI